MIGRLLCRVGLHHEPVERRHLTDTGRWWVQCTRCGRIAWSE